MPQSLKKPSTKQPAESKLRAKVARVAERLESIYGAPRFAQGAPVLDSLIGCILSQNTTDQNSAAAWHRLKERFPTWEKAASAPRRRILSAIRAGGLAPSKSKRIKAILASLENSSPPYSLEFVRDMKDDEAVEFMTSMNGVGLKTAAVVLLFACGRDIFPVDTHVHRIAGRLGFVPQGTTRDGVFLAMRPLVPPNKAHSFHVNLIRFGKERCKKQSPSCKGCPLHRSCLYIKGSVSF